jgi:hypothetical protein
MDFVVAALLLAPTVVAAGEDIAEFVAWAISIYDSETGPTDADWDALYAREKVLIAKLA